MRFDRSPPCYFGQVICAGTLSYGEKLTEPIDHAAVHAIVSVLSQRDALQHEFDVLKKLHLDERKAGMEAFRKLEGELATARETIAALQYKDAEWTNWLANLRRIKKHAAVLVQQVEIGPEFEPPRRPLPPPPKNEPATTGKP